MLTIHCIACRSKWLPVNICVRDGILVIKRSAPPTMPAISSETVVRPDAPPLHEIKLLHNHTLTLPSSRAFDKKTKIHQIKLQQTQVGVAGVWLQEGVGVVLPD